MLILFHVFPFTYIPGIIKSKDIFRSNECRGVIYRYVVDSGIAGAADPGRVDFVDIPCEYVYPYGIFQWTAFDCHPGFLYGI